MNDYVDKAREALAAKRRVEIDQHYTQPGATMQVARENSVRADAENRAGHYVMKILNDRGERAQECGVDRDTARALIAEGAVFIGAEIVRP